VASGGAALRFRDVDVGEVVVRGFGVVTFRLRGDGVVGDDCVGFM